VCACKHTCHKEDTGDRGGGRGSRRRKGRRRKDGTGEEKDKIDETWRGSGERMSLLDFNRTEGGDGEE